MPDFTNFGQPEEQIDDEVQKALLDAFGDDAMDLLKEFDESDLPDLAEAGEVLEAVAEDPSASASLDSLLNELSAQLDQGVPARTEPEQQNESDEEDEQVVDLGPRHVVFEVGDQQYGIPLEGVLEIDRCGKVTSLPRTPNWLRGVTNLRGQILSVTDFRDLLGMTDRRLSVGEKIIVVHSERHHARTALVVDRVLGIRNLRGEQGPLEGLSDRLAVFADSLAVTDQATTVLIDPDRLLGSDELSAFATE